MKRKNINFVHLGNGISIYRRDIEVNGDYPIIAHIDSARNISYPKLLDESLINNKLKKWINDYARFADPNISVTQSQKVFIERPKCKYCITGIKANGKRFVPIYTNTPQHYNIYNGTFWKFNNEGKRIKIINL